MECIIYAMSAGTIVLILIAALILAAAAWVAADISRNRRYPKIPSIQQGARGGECRALLALHEGREYDSQDIQFACDYADARNDCADFTLQTLQRVYLSHGGALRTEDAERIKRTLLGFRYWMDEPGEDGMCFWSENHQLLFATAEFISGGLFPDEVFKNSGMAGRRHREKARGRILLWLALRWDYGFSEWYSNVYYVEDAAPLANLIEFSGDPEITEKATIILDLLLFDIASQAHRGWFVTASGRLYEANKKSGRGASTNGIAHKAFGLPAEPPEGHGLDVNFLLLEGYDVPEVLREIARDCGPREVRASSGLDVSELRREGLTREPLRRLLAQWGMEAFTNPEAINFSLDYIRRNRLFSNAFLHEFKRINIGLLRRAGLLPLVSRLFRPQTNGVAIQRANTYTYRTPRWSMYAAQAHRPGECLDQQHIHGVTAGPDICVFTTHPAIEAARARGEDGTPNYWVGGGRLPHAAQERNVTLVIYRLPRRGGLLENPVLPYTHAWFPSARFDEARAEGRFAFGRKGGAYVALIGASELRFADGSAGDLIQRGRETAWVLEAGSAEEESFVAFMGRVRANRFAFDGRRLVYASGGHEYALEYKGAFRVDGEAREFRYPRFGSDYARAAREPETIRIAFGGKSLELDFENRRRVR
jgi:hypothetical protein